MEGLVNYSSEDELDEQNYKSAAERGSYMKRATAANDADDARRRRGDSGGGRSSNAAAFPSSSSSTGGRNYKEEDTRKYKSPSTSTASSLHGSSGRASSQYHYKRDNRELRDAVDARDSRDYKSSPRHARDARDNKDYKTRDNKDYKDSPRDNRDSRDYSNGNRNDYKNERINRSKEYNRDHRRDNDGYRDTRKPRDDDRKQRGGASAGDAYNNRHASASFSSHHNNAARANDTSNQRRQQRSREERVDNRADYRSERYGRKQRSPDSRSPSPTSHSKRYTSRNEERTRNRARDSNSRSRSRSRSRSDSSTSSQKRSPSPCTRERPPKPLDQARSTALDLERKLTATTESLAEREPIRPLLRNTEALLSLPLSDAPKPPTVIAVAPAANSSSGSEPAVIQLPSYYNPSVINPNKYAEQVQKRKLIWGAKKAEDTSAKWGHAQFSQDSDGKVASKFMRLMGIKGAVGKSDAASAEADKKPAVTDVKSREQMFTSMEQQYEVARQVTHTMRGVGLGFSSQSRPF